MHQSAESSHAGRWMVAVVAAACVAALAATAFIGTGVIAAFASTAAGGPAAQLNADAIPPHARYLTSWVIGAGSTCAQITAPMIAAQLDLESGWDADAVAHNPADRGGDAIGIAQFQIGTWTTWGDDYDHDGRNHPTDPEDAIIAMGRLMCDLASWAARNIAAGQLHGDLHDLAWAAYLCGRGCILAAGGIPAAGPAHDYPHQVRARISRYTLTAAAPGEWRAPLPAGSYQLVSRFRPPTRPAHDGIDLAAPTGTPIYAAAGGVVLDAGCTSAYCDRPGSPTLGGCGLRVNLNHGNGIGTRYCHAVRLAVHAGMQVVAGQLLGWVGSTGNSSEPHLHFEVHRNAPPLTSGNAVDPLPFLNTVGVHIPH